MLELGTIIDDKYKILNKIGEGGMSIVYLAMNERANKQWAIKEVRKKGVENYEVIKQGQIVETNMLKQLNHPNLPSIIDVIDEEDTFLIVMDYIEGNPLSRRIEENGAQPYEEVIEWSKQLCDVLGYLHSRKPPIIYRDMKPSNVMLKPDGTVMLIDFGTAREFKEKSVEDTTCLGTQGYAAPEQFGGRGQTDARTDVYCLGATMYHLVTGHNPSEPPYEMYPIRHWNPLLSSGLEKIIIKCTQRNPDDRFESCGELYYALKHYKEAEDEYQKTQNRRWTLFVATVSLSVIFGIFAFLCNFGIHKATENNYGVYMEYANTAIEAIEKYEYYKKAIELDPANKEAYLSMIEAMRIDGIFTEEENKIIRSVMALGKGALSKNPDAYYEVAYQLGIMYYYYYEKNENKRDAENWLKIAGEAPVSDNMTQAMITRAKRLGEVAGYFDLLEITNKEGDAQASYSKYWQDITELTNEDIAKEDNNVTALVMYKFMAYQIATYAQRYKEAGITKTMMEDEITTIQRALDALVLKDSKYEEELKQTILGYLQLAKNSVENTFDEVNVPKENTQQVVE